MSIGTTTEEGDGEAADAPVRWSGSRRRRAVGTIAVLAVAVLAAAAVGTVGELRELRTETGTAQADALAYRADRVRLGADLASTQDDLAKTLSSLSSRIAERTALDAQVADLWDQLQGVNRKIEAVSESIKYRVLNIASTKRCLVGVKRAIEQVSVDDVRGTVATLSSVRSVCDEAQAAAATNR